MRLVSYTRTTTCFPGEQISDTTITEQNDRIATYASLHGWKVSGKYSDRKKDQKENSAFERLLADGMQRKFDAVIVPSIFRAGKDLWGAKDVLLQTFHYAGIGFVVVDDDFISIGKSNQDAERYFDEKYSQLRQENIRYHVNRRNRKGILSWNDLKYGYKLTKDYQLVIDPETAPVVKRMFEMCAGGMHPAEIAEVFKQERIPIPLVSRGMNVKIPDPYNWDRQSIRRLLDKTVYVGHWSKVVQGETMYFENEPIVDLAIFQKVQDYLKAIATHAKPPRPKQRYSMLVKDKERGFCFHLRNSKYGYSYFTFASTPKGYEGKTKLLVTDLEASLRETLNAARAEAARLKDCIEHEGDRWLAQFIQKQKEEFSGSAFMLAELEQSRIETYKKYADGEVSQQVMESKNRSFRDFSEKQEIEFKKRINALERKRRAVCLDNPWINLFLTWDINKDFDRETLVKYISSITLDHMEIDKIELVLEEWYLELPEEWRKQNGEKE